MALLAWLGTGELIGIGIVALLVFGKRLPEVGRSVGRSIVEFKKGIKGIEEEIETESASGLPDNSPGKIEDQAATRKAPEESQPRQEEKKTEEIASSESERTES